MQLKKPKLAGTPRQTSKFLLYLKSSPDSNDLLLIYVFKSLGKLIWLYTKGMQNFFLDQS